MNSKDVKLFSHLTKDVVSGIKGMRLESYLIALEGWRRGLTLKWYKDETSLCKLNTLNSSTHGKFFSLTSEYRSHYFFRSRGDLVSNKAVRICRNKEETKNILKQAGVPVPEGELFNIDNQEEIVTYAEKIGYPVIIKPLNGSMGRGVYINLNDKEQLMNAVKDTRSTYKYKEYLVEKHYPGKEYRIYVVGDKAVVATNRVPANIIGDGKSSIKNLIKLKNRERKKNPYLAVKPIKLDYEVQNSLKNLDYNEKSIPKQGEIIYLRQKSNLSAGGDPIETTGELSEEIKQIAVDALKAMPSIPHAGVDVIVDPESNKKGVVLEINATAETAFHCFPLKGEAKDVPRAIIDYYFPETIGREKPNFYFDYKSLLEPLRTWAAEELTVSKPLIGNLYSKKYIVSGTVSKVGYMNWIKRQALKRNLVGYIKKIHEKKVEVFVVGLDKVEVYEFENQCRKGSKKSKIEDVVEKKAQIRSDQPLKNGFEVIL